MVEIIRRCKLKKVLTGLAVFVLVATIMPALSFAQSTEIYINNGPLTIGKNSIVTVIVRETGTRKLVEGAEVTMDGCGVGAIKKSNAKGEAIFNITPTEEGKINVIVKLEGYHPTDTTIPVSPDKSEPPLDIDPIPSPTNQRQITIVGKTRPGCEVMVGNVKATVDANGNFKAVVSLTEGKNVFRVKSSTSYASSSREVTVEFDSQNPAVIVETKLSKEHYIDVEKITIQGRVEPGSKVTVNGIEAIVVNDYFIAEVPVKLGTNTIEIIATDRVGNTSKLNYEVKVWHLKVVKITINSTQAFVDGVEETLTAPPTIVSGRTLVPLRFVGTAFGAQFNYDQATRTITITYEGKTIILTIGSKTAIVDNATVTVDPPAQIVKSSTMVPLRFIADAFGAQTAYDAQTRTVTVTKEVLPQ
jgi:hypothetical protein